MFLILSLCSLFISVQLTGGVLHEMWRIQQPLKVLRNLLLTSDPERSYQIGRELGLPHVLFELVHDTVENSSFMEVTAQTWRQTPAAVPVTTSTDAFLSSSSCSAAGERPNTRRNDHCARVLLGEAL